MISEPKVTAFSMKRSGYLATLLISREDGAIYEFEMEYEELKELMFLAAHVFDEMNAEAFADMAAENDALNRAEDDMIRQKETALEIDFNNKGYDDIPF